MKKIIGMIMLLSISTLIYADQYQQQYQHGGGYQHQEQYQSNQQYHSNGNQYYGNKHGSNKQQHRYFDQKGYHYYIPYNNGYQRGGVSIVTPGLQLNIR